MPVVPIYNRQAGIPTQGGQARGDVAAAGVVGATIARGFGQVADVTTAVAGKLQMAADEQKLQETLSSAQRDLLTLKFGALQPKTTTDENGNTVAQPVDWSAAPDAFVKDAAAIRDRYAGQLGAGHVGLAFKRHFDTLSTTAEFDVRTKARENLVKSADAQNLDTLDTLVPLAVHAGNPVARQAAIDQGTMAIDRMQALGVIDPVEAQKRQKKFLGQIDEAQVLGRFNGDESAVNGAVAELQSGAYPNLDAVQQERLIRTGQTRADALARERIASGDRAERQAALALRTTQAKNEAALIAQAQSDPNAVSEVDLADKVGRQEISPEGLNAIRAVRGRALSGVDDPRTVVDLQDRMLKGEDVHDAVLAATGNSLSGPTAASMLAENQRRRDAAGKEDWHTDNEKNAYQYIGTYLGKDKLAFSFDEDTAQRLAGAQREFIARVKDRKEDPWTVADDIVAKYGRTATAPPALGYGLGAPATADDVKAMGTRLRALRDGGTIAQPDYDREMGVLKRWSDIIAAQPPVKPKSGQGGR